MPEEYIDYRATLRLELQGAERRLALAKTALDDFHGEHDGKTVSTELAASFAREQNLLETELDCARRRFEESLRQLREMESNDK